MLKSALVISVLAIFTVRATEDLYAKCGDSYQCAEQEIVKVVDDFDQPEMAILGDAVVIEKTVNGSNAQRSSEDLIDRMVRYIQEHQLRIRFPRDSESARKLLSEARTKKVRKILLPFLLLLKLKAAVIIPAVLSAIALVAFKGLGVSLVALVFSGIAAFKAASFDTGSSSKFSYEIVPPQLGASPWSRTGANQLENWPAQGYHTIP